MKKILLGIALSVIALQGCKKDNDEETVVELSMDEQKSYDDDAAKNFMETHYFDKKGLIVEFDDTDTADDNEKKLSAYSPVTLPSGVIYIKIADSVQPNPGKEIGTTDVISFFQVTKSYVSAKVNDKIVFGSESTFNNNVLGSGVPTPDPAYYYIKDSVLKKYNDTYKTSYTKSFYEIEGLQEGLKYFKSFDLTDAADYHMQGVIIVPSRAAYARDNNYYGYVNRSFVFNFQIYNTRARNMNTEN